MCRSEAGATWSVFCSVHPLYKLLGRHARFAALGCCGELVSFLASFVCCGSRPKAVYMVGLFFVNMVWYTYFMDGMGSVARTLARPNVCGHGASSSSTVPHTQLLNALLQIMWVSIYLE
jgi:hypothetical protein